MVRETLKTFGIMRKDLMVASQRTKTTTGSFSSPFTRQIILKSKLQAGYNEREQVIVSSRNKDHGLRQGPGQGLPVS